MVLWTLLMVRLKKLNGFLQQTGVTGALDSIANVPSQAGGIVGDVINAITDVIGSLTSAVGDIRSKWEV